MGGTFFWAPIPVNRYEIRFGYGPDWSHLLKKSEMKKCIFCAVSDPLFVFAPNNKTLIKQKEFNWKIELNS